jgi:hypothetical protein
MEKAQVLTKDQRVQIARNLYDILEAKQHGAIIIDPPYPETDRLTPIVAEYVKGLKPADVKDDPPSLIPFAYRG